MSPRVSRRRRVTGRACGSQYGSWPWTPCRPRRRFRISPSCTACAAASTAFNRNRQTLLIVIAATRASIRLYSAAWRGDSAEAGLHHVPRNRFVNLFCVEAGAPNGFSDNFSRRVQARRIRRGRLENLPMAFERRRMTGTFHGHGRPPVSGKQYYSAMGKSTLRRGECEDGANPCPYGDEISLQRLPRHQVGFIRARRKDRHGIQKR